MIITKDLLLERLQILNQELQSNQSNINQLTANANAIHGAIQDCNFWIEQFDKNVEDDLENV